MYHDFSINPCGRVSVLFWRADNPHDPHSSFHFRFYFFGSVFEVGFSLGWFWGVDTAKSFCYNLTRTKENKGLQHEMEHKATIEQIIADAKAGKVQPVEVYLQQMVDTHEAKDKLYYDHLAAMEHEAGESDGKEAGEPAAEDKESPEKKDDERVQKAYESFCNKDGGGESIEKDKATPYTEK